MIFSNFKYKITLLILVVTNIHVWPYNTCVSRNNTFIEAQNHFRNKTSTDTAVQTFTSTHQYATCMSTKLTQVFSNPAKPYDVLDRGMLLQKLFSWHKRYNKLVVKIIYCTQVPYNIPMWGYKFCSEKWNIRCRTVQFLVQYYVYYLQMSFCENGLLMETWKHSQNNPFIINT